MFERDPTCRLCPLWEGCRSVCIPTRSVVAGVSPDQPQHEACILVVGEAPGAYEDEQDKSFVGPSGQLLQQVYLDHFRFPARADVYLANAVRCRPPQNATPTAGQVKKCSPYLKRDLELLSRSYKTVYVLLVGGTAAKAFGFKSLTEALNHQGKEWNNDRSK